MDTLNVHLIPHSHDDVGWLKTPDQYYFQGMTTFSTLKFYHLRNGVVENLLDLYFFIFNLFLIKISSFIIIIYQFYSFLYFVIDFRRTACNQFCG